MTLDRQNQNAFQEVVVEEPCVTVPAPVRLDFYSSGLTG